MSGFRSSCDKPRHRARSSSQISDGTAVDRSLRFAVSKIAELFEFFVGVLFVERTSVTHGTFVDLVLDCVFFDSHFVIRRYLAAHIPMDLQGVQNPFNL